MYIDVQMPIPSIPGKVFRSTIKGVTYIYYQISTRYDKERRFNIPRRTTIGKLVSPDTMIPNENFRKFLPEIPIPGEKFHSSRSSCLHVGAYIVIDKLIRDYKLKDYLSPYFKSPNLGLVLDLVTYSIICENNAAQYYSSYADNHPLFSRQMHIYGDSKISEFLATITDKQTSGFLNSWNSRRNYTERIYLSYDATNKNCQAGDLELVEYGKPKNDLGLPVFNYSIAFDTTNKEPLFYELYPGSIVDVSQLQYAIEKAKAFGYENIGFILDRGYFSRANIAYLDLNGYSFVIMVKGMSKLVSELIMKCKGSFEVKRSCWIPEYGVYGMTVKQPLYAEDTRNRYLHIYFNSDRQAAERKVIENKIAELTKFLRRHEGKVLPGQDSFARYFDVITTPDSHKLLTFKEKSDVIERELLLCGYFVIATSEKMDAREALILYKGRDPSEKLFRTDKSYLGSKSLRICSDAAAESKVLIAFIALIIRNRLYNYLKSATLKNEKKANYMTVPAALRELEKIEMVRRNDNIYHQDRAITATQKAILSALGLNEEYVKQGISEISERLKEIDSTAEVK